MGTELVDQVRADGTIIQAEDRKLSTAKKNGLLLDALPGAQIIEFGGRNLIRYRDQLVLVKQVTHLGRPWPGFKKRIQIPNSWLDISREATERGLTVRFVGIYHHEGVTIFVDFDPTTYLERKANNSAAHVATNDLFQAQRLGEFSRRDRNGNRLTSIASAWFSRYLDFGLEKQDPRLAVFEHFNRQFLNGDWIEALTATKQMLAANWPDAFQGEWPGFYLEFSLNSLIVSEGFDGFVQFQKSKRQGTFDYDLLLKQDGVLDFYGDLKSSDVSATESPGNDAADLRRCIERYGRFWYVIFEHETEHARHHGDVATIAWNEWRRSAGHVPRKDFSPLSYSSRFKQSVRFVKMSILELNQANSDLVLTDFAQGRQPSGAARELKVMIKKRNIDNFLIFSADIRAQHRA